ncbi:hypothetical protein N7471_003255 [Penicillium samsonianum]|uniref:uncharacterized protein n=1 Tax=Penicillium samsonianum TaxID=1882272 RepID=UPI0025474974|nr:uncharacterized protein N7471_003255 [Penicillium samsonianum]KAJ6143802.1 hypothetical protein N7471_003255 [Penicillium samsonianum]
MPTTIPPPPKHTEPNQNPKASKAGNVQPNQQIRPHRRPSLSPRPTHQDTLLPSTNHPPPQTAIPVSATPIPDTPLAQRINAYARTHLPEETYSHSRRVYHSGLAIKR